MSRIGKKPITIPGGVELHIDGNTVRVKGPKGSLERTFRLAKVRLERAGAELQVLRNEETRFGRAEQGLTRTLIFNMIEGVLKGYTKELEISGTGYRAQLDGRDVSLALGFTQPVKFKAPEGVTFEVPLPVRLKVSGINKELVGQVAAQIRALRPPEPYKGKGVKYADEVIRRKAGKTGLK